MNNLLKSLTLGISLMGCLPSIYADNVYLHSGNSIVDWKVKPQAELMQQNQDFLKVGYNASSWVDEVVPSTVFNSYIIGGLEKSPNLSNNIHHVELSKYNRSFWNRTELSVFKDFDRLSG